jgi:hypothetical protein
MLPCLALCGGIGSAVWAAEIRSYSPERHDRFTGFPAAPVWNEKSWNDGRSYAGIGWWEQDPRYQYTLVTPRHFVCAAHARPPGGSTVRFLQPDGVMVQRIVTGFTTILTPEGGATDLALAVLAAPVPQEIGFFPILNLPTEASYPGLELVVFGLAAKSGRGVFDSFHASTIPGLGDSRLFVFKFRKASGDPDDAYLQNGDSGSPSFALAAGRPALVGVHGAIGDGGEFRLNYDTFVPHYASQLNALLDPQGYRLTAAYPEAVELEAEVVAEPRPLRQGMAGSGRFLVLNRSAADAANVRITLQFPRNAMPETLTAPGWLVENQGGGGQWSLRRGSIGALAHATFTASWSHLPVTGPLVVELMHYSDGSPLRSHTFDLTPAPSYAGWSEIFGDADAGPADDPDGDGVVNLLEYAFGSDPLDATRGGMPDFTFDGTTAQLSFPMLEDAALRGLAYLPEFSQTLKPDSWTDQPPAGFRVEDSPPESGRVLRTIRFDASQPQVFARVRVLLNEAGD